MNTNCTPRKGEKVKRIKIQNLNRCSVFVYVSPCNGLLKITAQKKTIITIAAHNDWNWNESVQCHNISGKIVRKNKLHTQTHAQEQDREREKRTTNNIIGINNFNKSNQLWKWNWTEPLHVAQYVKWIEKKNFEELKQEACKKIKKSQNFFSLWIVNFSICRYALQSHYIWVHTKRQKHCFIIDLFLNEVNNRFALVVFFFFFNPRSSVTVINLKLVRANWCLKIIQLEDWLAELLMRLPCAK